MTRDQLASMLRVARQRMMRRMYIGAAAIIGLAMPLVFLTAAGFITSQTFKGSLCIYSFASVAAVIYILRRYGAREALCPHCQKPLWPDPQAYQTFASGHCAYCDYDFAKDQPVV